MTKLFLSRLNGPGGAAAATVIINVSSGAAHFGLPLMSLYNSSKGALDMFTEGVQYELAALDPPVIIKLVVPHGGIQSTNFGSNAAAKLKPLQSSADLVLKYGAFAQRSQAKFSQMAGHSMPIEMVAEKVWDAATDGSSKLRYFISVAQCRTKLKEEDGGMCGFGDFWMKRTQDMSNTCEASSRNREILITRTRHVIKSNPLILLRPDYLQKDAATEASPSATLLTESTSTNSLLTVHAKPPWSP